MTAALSIDSLADEPLDAFDAAFVVAVGRVQALADPPPHGLTDRIRFELSLRALRAEIAEIQSSAQLADVRSQAAPEMFDTLSFSARMSRLACSSEYSLMTSLLANAECR